MRKCFLPQHKTILVLGLFYCCLCGFTKDISEIEKAILQKEFPLAEQLASQLSSSSQITTDTKRQALYYLGLSQLNQSKYEDAQKNLSKLSQERLSSPLKDKVYLALCDAYFLSEQYPKALEAVGKLLKSNPQSDFLSLIYLKAARVNLKMAEWSKAGDYLKDIVEKFPNSMEVYIAKQLLDEKQYFAVQVGSFLERERAEQLATELKKKGEYAYIVETIDHQNRKLFRVRVGQLALLNEAKKLKLELSKQGYPTQIYP